MSSRVKGKENARVRAAEMRAAQARLERRRRIQAATAALAVVILIVGGLVLAKLTGGGGTTTAAAKSSTLPASVLHGITTVPTATSDKVGAAGVTAVPTSIKAPPLTADGKPKVLYIGAEYCPYCAAERWPLVVALSRFGTWSGLRATTSSATDVFPNTATLSFHGATFTSDALTFTAYETSDNKQAPLDTPSAADEATFTSYNKPPYIADSSGGIPFVDIGGAYVSSGASFGPEVLAGKTRAQITKAINDPSSKIGKAVLGNANVVTAAICAVTGDKPANVCASSGVKAGAAALLTDQPSK
jgi:Domain of unknown function (DUF929).